MIEFADRTYVVKGTTFGKTTDGDWGAIDRNGALVGRWPKGNQARTALWSWHMGPPPDAPFREKVERALATRLGYGNPAARIWIVGLEEGCPDPSWERLDRWLDGPPIEDLATAHRRFGHLEHIGEDKPLQSTWKHLIRLLLQVCGDDAPTDEQLRCQQTRAWGTPEGDVLLGELNPLPNPSKDDWIYGGLGGVLASRRDYERAWEARRIELWRGQWAAKRPDLVIAYADVGWPWFKRIFDRAAWSVAADTYELGVQEGTGIALIHHPRKQKSGYPKQVVDHLRRFVAGGKP